MIPKQYNLIVAQLFLATNEGRVNWQESGQVVFVAFPRYTLELWPYSDKERAPEAPSDGFAMQLKDAKGVRVDGFSVDASDAEVMRLEKLYQAALRIARRVDAALDDLSKQLAAGGTIGVPTAEYDPRVECLRRISGYWDLDYVKGKERLRIDDGGNYFIVMAGSERLAFSLENIKFDSTTSTIAFDKVRPPSAPGAKGHLHATDTVTVSADGKTMAGRDTLGNVLRYSRV